MVHMKSMLKYLIIVMMKFLFVLFTVFKMDPECLRLFRDRKCCTEYLNKHGHTIYAQQFQILLQLGLYEHVKWIIFILQQV